MCMALFLKLGCHLLIISKTSILRPKNLVLVPGPWRCGINKNYHLGSILHDTKQCTIDLNDCDLYLSSSGGYISALFIFVWPIIEFYLYLDIALKILFPQCGCNSCFAGNVYWFIFIVPLVEGRKVVIRS